MGNYGTANTRIPSNTVRFANSLEFTPEDLIQADFTSLPRLGQFSFGSNVQVGVKGSFGRLAPGGTATHEPRDGGGANARPSNKEQK